MKPACRPASIVAIGSFAAAHAFAQSPAGVPAQGVVALSSSASVDVTKDVLSVVLSATRDGADAATVQAQLKQALDAALAEAKKAARPGQVDVQTGNFSLYPRYSNKATISGWQGSAELLLEGRDIPAIAQLSGRLPSMTIARVGFGLSREVRERVEGEAAAQAIARYRAKAADVTRQFGFASYQIREVSVTTQEPTNGMASATRMRAMASQGEDAAVPVEPGRGSVTVSVSGTIQMSGAAR